MSGFGYDVLGFGSGAGVAPPEVDDEFNRVSFLSHFDGANNGVNNEYDDGSASNHTVSRSGDAQQGSFGPFARPEGYWAVGLNTSTTATETGYLRAPSSGNFGTGNFTYEAWVYLLEGGGNPYLLANSGGAVAVFRFGDSTSYLFGHNTVTSQTSVNFSDLSAAKFQWNHIALVRSSGVIKCFLNGTASSTTLSSSQTTGAAEYIGTARNFTSDGRLFDGFISNVRFSNIARYTSNFTPSTAPFASDSNTDLLTCQSNRFIDNSSNGRTVTPYGGANAKVSAFGPFLTDAAYDPAVNGASTHFDGNGDYLSAPDSADWNLGSGLFTAEAWVYPKAFVAQAIIMGQWRNPYAWTILFKNDTSGTLRFIIYDGGFNDYISEAQVPSNAWSHIALSREANNVFSLYLNGVRVKTATNNTTISDVNSVFLVGGQGGENFWKGYITDVRLVKGTAVYSGASLTVPTAPLTAITNTKLLLNMADGQAIDSASQRTLILEGNTKLSTGQAKFGDTSMAFDETNDYAIFPYESFVPFGTSDFTIECFARFAVSTVNNGQGLFQLSSGYLVGNQRGPSVSAYEDGGRWAIYYGAAEAVSSVVPATNTWYHVAYVRSSGTTKLYIDGTQILSVSDTTNYTDTYFTIGGYYTTGYLLNGYIDEFRISRMARYTNNFTAPTAPFPDQGQV